MKVIDIATAIDIASRTIAQESTLKRGAQSGLPPIAGGVTCDNSDLCSYLVDILGTKYPGEFDIKYYVAAMFNNLMPGISPESWLEQYITYLKSAVDHITVEVNRTGETIGTPSSGETVFGDLQELKGDTDQIISTQANQEVDYLIPTLAALPYPNSQANDVHADINRAIASILLGNALSDLIKDAVGTITDPIGTLLSTIQLAFPNHSSSVTNVNYTTTLLGEGTSPPISALTFGTAVSLGAGADVDIPTGTYGYAFSFTVPSYWGSRGFFAQDKTPSVAVLDWLYDAYSFDNPHYIRREAYLAYPLHPAANRFTVDLAAGVTGTYTPLRL